MPYERVWIPDLQQWKIIGELSGEEALALSESIPAGMTQWVWGASSGTFAYGNILNSRLTTYESPPASVSKYLIQKPQEYIPPDIPDEYKQYWSRVGTIPINGKNGNGDNLGLVGMSILLFTSILGGLKHGKKRSRSKQTA
jgi:hypothetical protein